MQGAHAEIEISDNDVQGDVYHFNLGWDAMANDEAFEAAVLEKSDNLKVAKEVSPSGEEARFVAVSGSNSACMIFKFDFSKIHRKIETASVGSRVFNLLPGVKVLMEYSFDGRTWTKIAERTYTEEENQSTFTAGEVVIEPKKTEQTFYYRAQFWPPEGGAFSGFATQWNRIFSGPDYDGFTVTISAPKQ